MPEIKEKRWILFWRHDSSHKWKRFSHDTFDTRRDAKIEYSFIMGYRGGDGDTPYDKAFTNGFIIARRCTVTTTWDNPGKER